MKHLNEKQLKSYQFLSLAVREPDEQSHQKLLQLSNESTLPKPPSLPELKQEHAKIFGHSVTLECPPYETYYGPRNLFQQVDELAKISGFYKAFGLNLAKDFHDRADHISVELEFMGFLILKEILAETEEQREIVQEAQKKFLAEHLGRWAGAFANAIVKNTEGEDFFHSTAKLLREFVEAELNRLDIKPEPLNHPVQWPATIDEGCGSCAKT